MFASIQGYIITFVASLVFGLGIGYHFGNKNFTQYKTEVATIAKVESEEAKQKEVKSNEITKEVVADYESKLNGLHISTNHFGLPSIPKAASGTDEAAAYYALTIECTETTVQLNSLQEWVKQEYIANDDKINSK